MNREHIITDQNLADSNFDILDGTDVRLMLRPNLQVTSTLESLKNEQTKKKAIFDLKNLLQVTPVGMSRTTFLSRVICEDTIVEKRPDVKFIFLLIGYLATSFC